MVYKCCAPKPGSELKKLANMMSEKMTSTTKPPMGAAAFAFGGLTEALEEAACSRRRWARGESAHGDVHRMRVERGRSTLHGDWLW
jgi:hypothetical protein